MNTKLIAPFLLTLVLTACGGGGGGGSSSPSAGVKDLELTYSDTSLALIPRLSYANFGNGQYVVMSGIYLGPNSTGPANPDAPLKVFKVTTTGLDDVTTQILGTNTTAPGNAIIADFNGDGVDDIFTGFYKDYPVNDTNGNVHNGNSVVFLSRTGTTHTRATIPGLSWSHQITATDIDNDGDIDVVNSEGKMWLNDGAGNFTFKNHDYNTSAFWMHGHGVCAGDFTNSGRTQLVITDLTLDPQIGPIADTAIFELDPTAEPIASHTLPIPLLDVGNTGAERSHDIGCTVIDINHDGLKDIIVFSRPWQWVTGSWNEPGKIQVLINQDNFQFTDASNSIINQNATAMPAYDYIVKDFNNDGKLDLFTGSQLFFSIGNTLTAQTLPLKTDYMIPISVPGGYKIMYVKDSLGQFTVNLTASIVNF